MLTNCPLGNKGTHDCWLCPFGTPRHDELGEIESYFCCHGDYGKKKKYKVKPRKVTHTFCTICGKPVKFRLDWDGVASPTRKGIITYKELYAYCPHCDNQVYVPAVHDVNVYRREKAYRDLLEDGGNK